MTTAMRLAIVDPDDSSRESLKSTLIHIESVWLEADCSRYEFFADVVEESQPDVGIVNLDSDAEKAIELIEQLDDTPSTYIEFLSAGRSGLHHYSTWFSDRKEYERTRSWALASNFGLVSECRPEDTSRLAYFETGNPSAPLFELSEALVPGVAEMMELVERTCREWDGKDPVRSPPGRETVPA